MGNRFPAVAVLIILLFGSGIFAGEWLAPVFAGKGGEKERNKYYDLKKDDAGNVWFLDAGSVYKYDKGVFEIIEGPGTSEDFEAPDVPKWDKKKGYGKQDKIYKIWCYDTLYCSVNVSPQEFRLFKLNKENKLELLGKYDSDFVFFKKKNEGFLVITSMGEVYNEKQKVIYKFDIFKTAWKTLNVRNIRFNEGFPGRVWIWTDSSEEMKSVFENRLHCVIEDKMNRIRIQAAGLSSITNVFETGDGGIYLSQYYGGFKIVKKEVYIEENTVKIRDIPDAPLIDKICLLGYFVDKKNKIWSIMQDNLNSLVKIVFYNGKEFEAYSEFSPENKYDINAELSIYQDDAENLWITSGRDYLLITDKKKTSNIINWENGLPLSSVHQVVSAEDGSMILFRDKSNLEDINKILSVVKPGALPNILREKVIKNFTEYQISGGPVFNGKGEFFCTTEEKNNTLLIKFDWNGTGEIARFEKQSIDKRKTGDRIFNYFGIDSKDRVWLIYRFYKSPEEYAAILGEEDIHNPKTTLKQMLLDNMSKGLSGEVEFSRSELKAYYNENGILTLLEGGGGIHSGSGGSYRYFEKLSYFKKPDQNGISIKFEKDEQAIVGVFKNPDGKYIVSTEKKWENASRSFVLENDDWKETKEYYPAKKKDWHEDQGVFLAELGVSRGCHILSISASDQLILFQDKSLFLKKNGQYFLFKDIPVYLTSGYNPVSSGFYDRAGGLWLKNGDNYFSKLVHIKQEEMQKVLKPVTVEFVRAQDESLVQDESAVSDTPKSEIQRRIASVNAEKRAKAAALKVKTAQKKNPAAKVNEEDLRSVLPFEETKVITGEFAWELKFEETVTELTPGNPEKSSEAKVAPAAENGLENRLAFEWKKILSMNREEAVFAEKVLINSGKSGRQFLMKQREKTKDEGLKWKIDAILSRME